MQTMRLLRLTMPGLALAAFLGLPIGTASAADTKEIDPLNVKSAVQPDISLASCTVAYNTQKTYALADLINLGLCNNNQTRAAWAGFLAQRSRLGSQRGSYLPTITAEGGYDRTIGRSDASQYDGSSGLGSAGISLDYLLYDFGQRDAQVEIVKQNLVQANYQNSLTIQSVLYGIVSAYYDYFAAQALLDAAKESEESSRVSLEAASLREKVGRAPVVERLQADAAYSQAKLARVQAESNREKAKGQLMQVLGLRPTDTIRVDIPRDEKIVDRKYIKSTEQILAYAEKQHPDVLSADAGVKSAQASLEAERSKRLPSIHATADAGTDRFASGNGIERDTAGVGVRVAFPLFTGFSRTYDIQTARHNVEQAQAQLGQARDRVRLDVWNAYQDFNTASQNISTTEALYASAGEAEKAALARYKSGKGSLIDLLNAQVQSASARQQRVQAKYDWYVTKANLLRAAGDIRTAQFEDVE